MSGVTYFGQTDFRNEQKKFGIKDKDRLRHLYIIGKTGVGKSTLIENMFAQDIINGNGCAILDPHGASAEMMLDYIPPERVDDVIYFAPFDMAHPISFNIMEDVGPDKRHHVANGILSVMKKIWVDAFSGRMEYIVQNTLLALMETPGSTLLGINRMLSDKEYRQMIIDNIQDPSVKSFWVDEYLKWDERYQREAGASIQNKIGQFTSNPLIRNIVGQPKSSFDIREIMDKKKILIANFSKGLLGEQNARLLGSLLSTSIYLAAMSRAELDEEEMKNVPPFYLYVDEFQNFANDSFADVLSEARKYKLSLTMAHQYIAQMPDTVREAIFGNVGTMITFRIGPEDAEAFEREFTPTFTAADFTNLGPYQIYLRLMIDGLNSSPFSARTLPPIAKAPVSMKLQAFTRSRELYANPRDNVQKAIENWFVPIPSKKQLEHQEYLAKKKAEIEAKGGEWVDTSGNASSTTTAPRKEYTPAPKKAPEGVYRSDRTSPPVPNSKPAPVSDRASSGRSVAQKSKSHQDTSRSESAPSEKRQITQQGNDRKTPETLQKKSRLGVDQSMVGSTRSKQSTTQALDDLITPSERKRREYEEKKKQKALLDKKKEELPGNETEDKNKEEDETPAQITLSSGLKNLLDGLDGDDFTEPIRIKDSADENSAKKSTEKKEEKKDRKNSHHKTPSTKTSDSKQQQQSKNTNKNDRERDKLSTDSHQQPKSNHKQSSPSSTSDRKTSQNNNNNNNNNTKETQENRKANTSPKKEEHTRPPRNSSSSHTSSKSQKTNSREASSGTKNALQAVLAKAMKEKQQIEKDDSDSKKSAKQDISKIVGDDVDTAQPLQKHLQNKTVAKNDAPSYTSTGIAPREENTSAEMKPSQQTPPIKKEATLDVLQDILSD